MATIENLPKEMLFEIFSHYIRSERHEAFLRNIPLVCKDWNKHSSDSSFWRNVRARDWNFLQKVSRRGLLENTQSLKSDCNGENYSDTKLSAVLENIRDLKALDLKGKTMSGDAIMLFAEHCPHLERLHLWMTESMTCRGWVRLFTTCGPTLKNLRLLFFFPPETGQLMLSRIVAKCPLLESLEIFLGRDVPLSIHELRSKCPSLKLLESQFCRFITAEKKDYLGCGFKDFKEFKAIMCNFDGLDVNSLFKDFVDLEQLVLYDNRNFVFDSVLKIPSNNLKILIIGTRYPNENLKALEDIIRKWRRTLTILRIFKWKCNISSALQNLFHDNPNPQLKTLTISDKIDSCFVQKCIQNCKNLIHLEIGGKKYIGREEIEKGFGISH